MWVGGCGLHVSDRSFTSCYCSKVTILLIGFKALTEMLVQSSSSVVGVEVEENYAVVQLLWMIQLGSSN